jgi:thiamine kinase-like enzyme
MEFCDGKIEYNEDTIMKVIDEIKKLHMTKCPTDIEIGHARTDVRSDLWHFYFNDNELHNPKLNRIVNIYEKVWENKYPLVISHNDVHRGNIVRKDEMIYLIDWDCVSMNDELTDICGFLRSCKVEVFNESNPAKYDNDAQELYNSIEKYIEYYYGRKCTTAELKLAYEDIFIFEMERLWFVKEQLNYMPEPLLSMILSHGEQFILQQIKEG